MIWGKRAKSLDAALRGLMVAAALACAQAPAAPAQQGDLHEQTEQVLDADDIQRDAPLAERARIQAEDIARDPNLQHEPPQPVEQPPASDISLPIPGDLFLYLLLATLAVCVCLVVFHLYRTYAPNRRAWSHGDSVQEVAARAVVASNDPPPPELDEIEKLARAGAYAEAIHLMLLRALETLRRRLGASWAKSLTSREITRRSELGATDRSALKVLVGAVEICRFGGQNANEQVYRACLDHYRLLGAERPAVQS